MSRGDKWVENARSYNIPEAETEMEYAQFLAAPMCSAADEKQINKDLHRTFPEVEGDHLAPHFLTPP